MMKKFIYICLLSLIPSAFAVNNTPNYYKCTDRKGGEWLWGRAPDVCDAKDWGSDSTVLQSYPTLIFQDNALRDEERRRYMEDLHAVIRDAAEYYIRKRKPNVSAEEKEWFKTGILTTASQESYWSHYRRYSDGKLKMMRGDYGHGHGLMQVDDRHHYPAVTNGTAWNLLGNIVYSMDEYYANWQRAANASCVGSATNYEARVRAAWAAYNGGPSRLCRWTNPNDTWARNDRGYYDHLKNKRWRTYISNFTKSAPINVPCLIEKRENCPGPGNPTTPALQENVLYRTTSGSPCVLKAGKLQCLEEYKDYLCLRHLSAFQSGNEIVITDELAKGRILLDRHSLCKSYDPTLIPVGTFMEAKNAIYLRSTPGGGELGIIREGEVLEVLDFELRNLGVNDRYYKVRYENKIGFAYAGNKTTEVSWFVPSSRTSPIPSVVARTGEAFEVKNNAGINLRRTAGGEFLRNVPVGTRLEVRSFLIRGVENHVYYEVSFGGDVGFLYSGALLPMDTTSNWTVRIR